MLLTGRRDKADVTRALQLGIDDYLVKPVDYDMLLSKIESLLQKKPGSHSFAETPVKVDATYTLNLQVVGLSESGIAVACPTPLPVNSKLQIESPLFDELGIPVPQMRVAACAPSKDNEKLFSIKMNFIGLSPNEYQKIRVWMMQNDPRKTKKAS